MYVSIFNLFQLTFYCFRSLVVFHSLNLIVVSNNPNVNKNIGLTDFSCAYVLSTRDKFSFFKNIFKEYTYLFVTLKKNATSKQSCKLMEVRKSDSNQILYFRGNLFKAMHRSFYAW